MCNNYSLRVLRYIWCLRPAPGRISLFLDSALLLLPDPVYTLLFPLCFRQITKQKSHVLFPPYRPRSGTAQHSNSSVYIMSILLYNILLEILFSCNNFNCCFVLVTVRFHGLFLLAHGVCAVNNADDESVNLEETLMAIVVRYIMVTHTQNYRQRWSPLESWNNSKVHRGQLREKRLGTKLRQPVILYCLISRKNVYERFSRFAGCLSWNNWHRKKKKKNPIRCLIIPSTFFFNFGK